MKKRLLALLLIALLVVGMFPTAAMADGVQEIKTAEAFAGMDPYGSYKLTRDIKITAPYGKVFKGEFDGGGNTITMKGVTVTSGSAGVFPEVSGGAKIHDLLADVSIVSTVGSSSHATGGLVGKVSGTTTIENCGVIGSVSNTHNGSSYGTYVGGLVGYLTANCVITNSFSACTVRNAGGASSAATGGLIGKTSNYYTLTVKNCYSTGSVTANKGYAGGITGYIYCSASYKHNYANCYASGEVKVTGAESNAYGFAYSYASAGFSFTDCYYNTANDNGFNKSSDGIIGKSADELKTLTLEGFVSDKRNINGGYPILSWQDIDPDAEHTVSLTIVPADSVLIWNGVLQDASADGVYSFTGAKYGDEYTYSVTNEAGDYAPKSGTINVKNKDVSAAVTLEQNKHDLSFTVMPENAALTVKDGEGSTLTAVSGRTYSVVNGTYGYEASAFGYEPESGSVEVNRGDASKTIELTALPGRSVSFAFSYDDGNPGGALPSVTVTHEVGGVMTAVSGVYSLPYGEYSYVIRARGYAKVEGKLTVSASSDETVNISLTASTAWDGESADEPEQTGGVYQISSGSELAWLAKEINSGSGSKYQAVLTADIDLADFAWEPMGKAYSTRFQGSLDGQGHTISGLNVTGSSSGNYGLFGYVDGGTVENLTVDGTVTITGSGSASYGIGGIVGQLNGTGSVKNCVNKAKVSGSTNVGGIVGYANGSSYEKTISGCVNLGKVSGGNSVGGIVGQFSGKGSVSDCYNRGQVSASVSKAGGIVGYLYSTGSSYKNSVSNCYSTGAVAAGSDAAAVVGKINNKSYSSVTNCYYLEGLAADSSASAVSSDGLKGLAGALGESFVTAPAAVNDGYPILGWQITRYTVTFNINSDKAVVSIDGQTGTRSGNKWIFELPDGEYKYTVSAFGKVTRKDADLKVEGEDIVLDITLDDAAKKTVTFKISPAAADAGVTVTWNGQTVEAKDGFTYELPYDEYVYTVKAKGYATVSDKLTVDAESAGEISITLVESSAWDGETRTAPTGDGTAVSPYQIEDGEQLAWLADKVNSGSGSEIYAVLTDDIDLGDKPWEPIGKDFNEFVGSFDGQNNTISGLNADTAYAGLFGYVKNAKIKDLVVRGKVNGSSEAGGIAARAKGNAEFTNCGNEADVTGGEIGGILGKNWSSSAKVVITGCYNTGSISSTTSSGRAGGILGYNNGTTTITDGYNTGSITSNGYAGGFAGCAGVSVTDGYNTGDVKGADSTKTGAFTTGAYDTLTNCYYLTGGNDRTGDATEMSLMEMQNSLLEKLGSGWKVVDGHNQNLPVLEWQKITVKPGGLGLAENVEFGYVEVPGDEELGIEDSGYMTPVLTWDAVDGATGYVVSLWTQRFVENENYDPEGDSAETDQYVIKTEYVTSIYDVTGTTYDCTKLLNELPEALYYATVAAKDADGRYTIPELEYVEENVCGWQNPYSHMKPITGLRWDGTVAKWDGKSYFTADQVYDVDLYVVNGNTYTFFTRQSVAGIYNAVNFGNVFAAQKQYAFTVTARSDEDILVRYGYIDSPVSEFSPVWSPEPDDPNKEWVNIYTAQQWIELANTEDAYSIPGDTSSPNKQEIAWGKNYRLMADIDFSTLSAADQAKTKSIGNVNYRFMGELDGNGKTITGLTLSNYDSGMFLYVGSTGYVHDLTIKNANVQFSDNSGILVHNNYGRIERCAVINCNITAYTGGVLGAMVSRNYGIIRESYVQGGTLTSTTTTSTGQAGFAGSNEAGGLIERCWTSMNVSTQSDYAGGFVGLGYGGTIRDCFALGDVSSRSYSGGFVGRSVFEGNVYENCYAAGVVSCTGAEGHGFIGGNRPDSAFGYDQSKTITNCYYNAASETESVNYGAMARSLEAMATDEFLTALNKNARWSRSEDKNNGLPYLTDIAAPENTATTEITVEIALAIYDKADYSFRQMGDVITVTMQSNGNTRLTDLMDAAVEQGRLTYSYKTTATFGRFIHTINGYSVDAPDGWMFTVNDKLSNLSASLTTVKDGDKVLWFEGTTSNRFQGPTWAELSGTAEEWIDISTPAKLAALASSSDPETLAKNYRLTANIDMAGTAFGGIGSASAPFTGKFDGQGFTVSNVTITGTGDCTGFFNAIKGAVITNLRLSNISVTGEKRTGGLVGWAQVQLDKENMADNIASLIGSCSVTGSVSGTERVGGVVGLNDGAYDKDTLFSIASAIDKCSFDGTVTGTADVGGFAGENSGVITSGSAAGTVTATGNGTVAGGFVGTNPGDIYDSHASADVEGKSHVGGFAGSSSGEVKRCYSLGSVTGGDYVGSFAGSISAADYVIGAGQVHRTAGAQGYVGGFAGNLGGTIVGLQNQITIKDSFGNCTQPDGKNLNAAGNSSSFTTDSAKKVLEDMALDTGKEVSDKLYEMFGVNLPELEDEAAKYADIIKAGDSGAVDPVKPGAAVDPSVTVYYNTDSEYLTGGDTLTVSKANNTSATMTAEAELILTNTSGITYRKTITVILPVSDDNRTGLMDTIASGYTGASDGWTVMDMAVYSTLDGKTSKTSDEAYQNALNLLITEASGSAGISARARIEIVLRAMGVDTTRLFAVNSNTPVDNAALLRKMDLTANGYYAAPWLLLADMQGNLALTQEQINSLIKLMKDNLSSKAWDDTTDVDTAAAALAALARFYDSDAEAKALADTILERLPGRMNDMGSFGNANTDAMVILGLMAMGRDPAAFTAGSGASVVDGLLCYTNGSGTGFLSPNWVTGALEDNALATEQAFRALVALAKYQGEAYNIYDFSKNTVKPGRATGTGEVEPIPDPVGPGTITVTFSLQAFNETWIPAMTLTLTEGSTVYHAFKAALAANGMSAVGAESGYVSSITKGSATLSEFDKGPNSGWMYKVNGVVPNVPLTGYKLSDGDSVAWFYTSDWTQEPDVDIGGETPESVIKKIDAIGEVTKDSGNVIKAAREAYDKLTEEQKKLVTNYDKLLEAEKKYAELTGLPFTDVKEGDYCYDAVKWAVENKITTGTTATTFSPDGYCTRAQAVTFLWRAAGCPEPEKSVNPFSDVQEGVYYYKAVLWAVEKGVTKGTSDTTFSPNLACTRGQIATFLYRYAGSPAPAGENPFTDVSGGEYYGAAVIWAAENGVTKGTGNGMFSPNLTCTRGEIVTFIYRFIVK